MMHSLPRQKSLVIVIIGLLAAALLLMVQPSYAITNDSNVSTVGLQVIVDQAKPENPGSNNGGVAQPDIPENGQEIHYSADGQNNGSTGKLPQTSAVQNSLITFVGIAMMLMAIVWRRQRRATKEEGYYES